MTDYSAIYSFFKSFGQNVYDEQQAVAINPYEKLPYITYSIQEGADGEKASITADIWYRSAYDHRGIEAIKDSILKAVGSGISLPCDGGGILLQPDKVFCKSVKDAKNPDLRRKTIFLTARYFIKRSGNINAQV